jgi:hypothetical protein
MSRRHISIGTAVLIMLFALFLVAIGFFAMIAGNIVGGLALIFGGLVVGGLNRIVFQVRRTQLEIDTRETVLQRLESRYCQYCGKPLSPNASFCPSCGHKVE